MACACGKWKIVCFFLRRNGRWWWDTHNTKISHVMCVTSNKLRYLKQLRFAAVAKFAVNISGQRLAVNGQSLRPVVQLANVTSREVLRQWLKLVLTSCYALTRKRLTTSGPTGTPMLPEIRILTDFDTKYGEKLTLLERGKQSNILSINFAFPSGSSGRHTPIKPKFKLKNPNISLFKGLPRASTVIWNKHFVNSGSGSSLR